MPRRVMTGTIVSDKGDKTVVVQVERTYLHPVLKKTIRRRSKFHAHDEANAFKTGEIVNIQECPPRSKLKRWEVVGRIGA
jgi:small subunit ribosomal protein S17